MLFDCEPPKSRIEAVRLVDMNASDYWAEFPALFCETREAHATHERAKSAQIADIDRANGMINLTSTCCTPQENGSPLIGRSAGYRRHLHPVGLVRR